MKKLEEELKGCCQFVFQSKVVEVAEDSDLWRWWVGPTSNTQLHLSFLACDSVYVYI